MLESAGIAFEAIPATVDEASLRAAILARSPRAAPEDVAAELACAKAEAVSRDNPDALVIGGDQVLALAGHVFEKCREAGEARAMLLRLRGRTHTLPTAVVVAEGGRTTWSHVDVPRLTMRDFSEAFLSRYLAELGGAVCGMLGAYELEGPGVQLFERVEGDYFSILGLPLLPLLAELRSRGVLLP